MIKAKPERQTNTLSMLPHGDQLTLGSFLTALVLITFYASQVKDNTIGPFVNNSFCSEPE